MLFWLWIPKEAFGETASPIYIGAKICKRCHLVQHLSWLNTKMARSFDLLKPNTRAATKRKAGLDPAKDYTQDSNCLKCHTTGFGRPGGFKSLRETPDKVGVQCEMCHGAGSFFIKVMKRKFSFAHAEVDNLGHIAPTREGADNVCVRACHNPQSPTYSPLYVNSPPPKDLKEKLKRGVHRIYGLKFKHW